MTNAGDENAPPIVPADSAEAQAEYEIRSSDPIVDELRTLAREKPNVFQMLIQQFWIGPGVQDRGGGAMQVPQEVIEKSLENDKERFHRTQNLRVLAAWLIFGFVIVLLTFVLVLTWLLRDHVEFTEKILACIALAISHGATARAYYSGKSRGARRRRS